MERILNNQSCQAVGCIAFNVDEGTKGIKKLLEIYTLRDILKDLFNISMR